MTDFSTPTNSSLYTAVLTALNGKIQSCAKMDFSGDTNIPTGTVAFDNSTGKFQRWNGSAWADALPAWQSWSPSYGASGPMTFTSVTTYYANYIRMGNLVMFYIYALGTTGGTADLYVTFTLPIAPLVNNVHQFSAEIYDVSLSGNVSLGHAFNVSSNVVGVFRYNSTNWGLGTNRQIFVSGFYKV